MSHPLVRPRLAAMALLSCLLACAGKDADEAHVHEPGTALPAADLDGDGFADDDCNDSDPAIHPGAPESCNGIDDNCDGAIDEASANPSDATTWYADTDGDGYGDPDTATLACSSPASHVEDGSDCDDLDGEIHPDADERCDGVDSDCDGLTDEDASDAQTWYADTDNDGFGDPDTVLVDCSKKTGLTSNAEDCDDGDPAIHPDATEISCNGIDEDCDGTDASGAVFENAKGERSELGEILSQGTEKKPATHTITEDGSLLFCEGTWYLALTVESASLTIQAATTGSRPTLSGGGLTTPITVDTEDTELWVEGLQLTSGMGEAGGAISFSAPEGMLTLVDTTFHDNEATIGGALYMPEGDLLVEDCTFTSNEASLNGGAIYLESATASITRSELSENIGAGYGGAIYGYTADLLVEDCEIATNQASYGAGIYDRDGPITCIDTQIRDNTASGAGGGIYTLYQGADLTDSSITGNTATYGGGAYLYWGTLSLSCPTAGGVSENTATLGGGAYVQYVGGVSSDGCDWGSGSTDNDPEDVFLADSELSASAYAAGASFSCSGKAGTCTDEP